MNKDQINKKIEAKIESLDLDKCSECGYHAVSTLEDAINYGISLMQNENENLSIKIQRTVDACYHALLEMSAWVGIPEDKRQKQIDSLMENVKYCAEHDLRKLDIQKIQDGVDRLKAELKNIKELSSSAERS